MNFKIKNDNINLDQLVGKLQKEDKRYALICRGLQVVYLIFIPFFSFMAIRHYMDSGEVNQLIGGLFFVLSFLTIAIIFGDYYKDYKYVDYSLPTLIMLKKAAYRYQPFQIKGLWIFLAILLTYVGIYFQSNQDEFFVREQLSLLGGVLIGGFIGLIIWYFKYKPLRDNALRLVAEIEGE